MKSLAVIGTGIAGMATAYLLRNTYRVTLYEKNDYIGGHTNTVFVPEGNKKIPIDTGFMVFNDRTYPNLIRFFDELGIESYDTSMSFSVNHPANGFEISFTDLTTFFPSLSSLLSVERYRLLAGLKELFAAAKEFIANEPDPSLTLGEFLINHETPALVSERFLVPMACAIWSTPPSRMMEYPAATLFRFLVNHGMLGFGVQFQWKTLKGGSQQYKNKLLDALSADVHVGHGAQRIRGLGNQAEVLTDRGDSRTFDKVVVATHADQALALLETPTAAEQRLLSCFKYNVNPVVLHSDASVMPKHPRAWASWNYRYENRNGAHIGSTHYWMNRLQNVSEKQDYFVSVDYDGPIDPEKIHWQKVYEHPRFDQAAIAAQTELPSLNQTGPIYFCGSYFRYGFHEDAFTSALNLSQSLEPSLAAVS